MDETRSNNTAVYRSTHHVVWCPKYRRKVITADVDTRLKQIIREVCDERNAPITELETMPDHVRLLVTCDPPYGIHRLLKQIKSSSSRLLRQEFPEIRTRIPTLWTNSYLAATIGSATPETVKKEEVCGEPAQHLTRRPSASTADGLSLTCSAGNPIPPHG